MPIGQQGLSVAIDANDRLGRAFEEGSGQSRLASQGVGGRSQVLCAAVLASGSIHGHSLPVRGSGTHSENSAGPGKNPGFQAVGNTVGDPGFYGGERGGATQRRYIIAAAMPKTRVLLADDHAVVAQGLAEILRTTFDLVGVVHDGRALLTAAASLTPDVIVTDVSMPLLNGLDAIRQIRSQLPRIKVVVLTMYTDTETAVGAFRAGARGYVPKVAAAEEFIAAVEEVSRGRAYISPLVTKDVIAMLMEVAAPGAAAAGSQLTARQREVLQLVAEGRTMKEIASILHISPRTAESHKYQVMQTLGIETTAGLVQYAVRSRLVG